MGFSKAVAELENESGLSLESLNMARLREFVIKGSWEELDTLVDQLELVHANEKEFRFMIRKQKYLELLEERKLSEALNVLQLEMTPLRIDTEELYRLSRLLLCANSQDIKNIACWDGMHGQSRSLLLNNLSKFLAPSMCVAPNRLNTLLDQALLLQQKNCIYHNQSLPTGLLVDHSCQRHDFPNTTTHVFQEHRDEVWYMAFSHDGSKLASASRDARAIIWDLDKFSLKFILCDHKKAISYLSWSPDDSLLITASNDTTLKIWDTKTGDLVHTFAKHVEAVTSCVWHPSGHSFFSGSVEKNMYQWSLNGEILRHWPGIRIMDLAITSDAKTLIACAEKKIRFFNLDGDGEEGEQLSEVESITSVCLSKDNKKLLVNLSVSEIHLWDLEERSIEKKYFGQKQGRFVIRSCIGGANENFVLSGSEDNHVYVWHRELGTIIENLPGHSACVNCVSWNPCRAMFASAADDHNIRIWGPDSSSKIKGTLGKKKIE